MGPGVLKPAYPRTDGRLRAGSVALDDLAERFGTPLYVYDAEIIRDRFQAIRGSFTDVDVLVAYSVKANGNLGVLSLLAGLGAGADIVSGGELYRALAAGIPPERILFAGVGKTESEIRYALERGILALNVESGQELELIARVARALGVRAPVALRLNPDIVSPTPHEYTRTGHLDTKFGVSESRLLELTRQAASEPALVVTGIDVHIGSQITRTEPFLSAVRQVLASADRLEGEGIPLRFVDLGGGFGVPYDHTPGLDMSALAEELGALFRGRSLRLIVEPGRFLVGEAGVLLTRVLYVKSEGRKTFVIVDGGMTDLLRPSHYGGYHHVSAVADNGQRPEATVDIVGPICETGDFLALDRELPLPEPGELLAVHTAGAYGFTMASNYNGRPRPAEVMVDGSRVELVRARESFDDLTRGERMPQWPSTRP